MADYFEGWSPEHFENFESDSFDDYLEEILHGVDTKIRSSNAIKYWVMISLFVFGLIGNICVFLSSFAHRKQLGVDSICFCALSLIDTIFLFHAPIKIDEIKTGHFRFGFYSCYSYCYTKDFVMIFSILLLLIMMRNRIDSTTKVSLKKKQTPKKQYTKRTWGFILAAGTFAIGIPAIQMTSIQYILNLSDNQNVETYLKHKEKDASKFFKDDDGRNFTCRIRWEERRRRTKAEFEACYEVYDTAQLNGSILLFNEDLPEICVNHCQYGFISKAEKLYRFFVIGVVFIFPLLYICYTFCYLSRKIKNLFVDQALGFGDKRVSFREAKSLNLMVYSFLLIYVTCYSPLHIYHAIRCFGIKVSSEGCEHFRQIVELLPWFHPVLNPLIYYFFGSICGPLQHTLNVDVLTKWGRSSIRRGSDESDVSTIVDDKSEEIPMNYTVHCRRPSGGYQQPFPGCEYKPGSKWPNFGIDPPARCNECKDCEENKECVNRPQYNPLRRFSQALLGDPFQPISTSPTVEMVKEGDSESNIDTLDEGPNGRNFRLPNWHVPTESCMKGRGNLAALL